VRRDPGTIRHVQHPTQQPPPTQNHHGTPSLLTDLPSVNSHLTPSFERSNESAKPNHPLTYQRRYHLSHHHQPEGRYSSPHALPTPHVNRMELHHKVQKKINRNSILKGNYATNQQPQSEPTIDITDYFTPIIRNCKPKVPQSTARTLTSNHRNTHISAKTQHLAPQGHHGILPPPATNGLQTKRSPDREGCNGEPTNPMHCNPRTNKGNSHDKTHLEPLPSTAINPHPEHCSNTIRSPNPSTTLRIHNRLRFVRIRHKGDTNKPRHQKQPCTLPPTVVSGDLPQSTARQEDITDLMNHLHSDSTQTNSILRYPMNATTINNTDDKLAAHHQNPLTQATTLHSSLTNCCYSVGNTSFQQQPEIKGTYPPVEPVRNNLMPSFSATNIIAANIQHNSMPYSRVYRYKKFCSTYDIPVKPGSMWHYQIRNAQ